MKVHQAPIFSKDCTPLWLSGYGKDRKSEAFFRDDHKILEVDFSDEFIWRFDFVKFKNPVQFSTLPPCPFISYCIGVL